MSKQVRPQNSTQIQSVQSLQRIAAALGLPESAFINGQHSGVDLADTSELLRIWYGLPNDADRRKVLALARAIADRS